MSWASAISNLVGSGLSYLSSKSANKKNARLQKDFAQNSIQWRVADAKKAGVHPIYALGAPTMSASPSYVGSDLQSGFANAGQDISRAIDASSSKSTRDAAYNEKLKAINLEHMDLQNELLKSQIARQRGQIGPPMPTDTVMGGKPIKADPNWSDADKITQRYGEPAEWLYSPIVMWSDAWKNFGSKAHKKQKAVAKRIVTEPRKEFWRAMKWYREMLGF